MAETPRVFFDSNVIFSGLYSREGPPARLLEAYTRGRLEMVISQQVLAEVVRTLEAKIPQALPVLYLLAILESDGYGQD